MIQTNGFILTLYFTVNGIKKLGVLALLLNLVAFLSYYYVP